MKDKYTGKDIVSPLDTLNETEPSVGVQPDVRPNEPGKTYKRLIVFTVERTNYPGESLIYELPHALREYADACEREELKHQGDVRKFYSSNRCIVKVIYGSHDFYPNEIRDESSDSDDR